MAEKTRYSDAELEEFRAIIMEKLQLAERDYEKLKSSIMNADGNDTDDTSPTYKVLEEGASTLSKEETTRLASRQLKFRSSFRLGSFRICRQLWYELKTKHMVFVAKQANLYQKNVFVQYLMLH